MTLPDSLRLRLAFLARVAGKECAHLLETDGSLFSDALTTQEAQKIALDPLLSERLDAFVSRFGRL